MPKLRARSRAAVLLSSGAVLATAAGVAGAPSSYADPLPDGTWSACANAEAQYCVQDASVTPAGGSATPLAEAGLSSWVMALNADNGVSSFNWAVNGLDSADPQFRTGDLRLVLRVGQFHPRYTMAFAAGLRITRSTDDASNTTMTITGQPTKVNFPSGDLFLSCMSGTDCGGPDDMADPNPNISGYRFSGNTQDLSTWGEDYTGALDGAYIATNALSRPTMVMFGTYPKPYWLLQNLGNVHLDPSGAPVRGSFNAWLPPSYFDSLGTTAAEAASVGFDVQSTEAGVDGSVSLPASVSLQDQGVAIDVPDMGFSVHNVEVVSQASQAVPGSTPPTAPTGVTVTPAVNGLSVGWAAAGGGGLPLTGYSARVYHSGTAGVLARCTAAAGSHGCTVSGLTAGTTYSVAVSATNALGEGHPATPVSGTAAEAPSAPRSVAVVPGNGRIAVTWAAPSSTGGPAIRGYTATAYSAATGGVPVRTCTSTGSTCTLTELANGTAYYVTVRASTVAAAGPEAGPRVVGTPRTVPGAPRSVTASSAGGRITARWTAPSGTGGAAVNGYRAEIWTASTGGSRATYCTASASARSCLSGRLPVGRVYYVSVVAGNAAGTSAPSNRAAVRVLR